MGRFEQGRRRRLVAVLTVAALAAGLATVAARAGAQAPAQTNPPGDGVVVARAHNGSGGPGLDDRLAVLVIGSDAGAPGYHRGGSAERGLADAIQLVVIDGKRKKGIVVGIPRDSYVPIPGRGTRKINSALNMGGPDLLVRTVEQLAGLQIDYYALTSFDGLERLVDGVGGVTVDVDRRVVDKAAGADLQKGRKRLKGSSALAYSRARKSLPNGDFGRSEHQGDVLLGGWRTFNAQSEKDPASIIRWLNLITREVKTDLKLSELFRLALFARQVPSRDIRNTVLSGRPSTAGGASVVQLDAGARQTLANIRAGRF